MSVDWVILHWYARGADRRSGGRAGGRCTVTRLPNFLGWVDYHISLAMGLRPRVELRYENREQCPLTRLVKMLMDSSGLPSSTFIVDEVFSLSAGNHISISIFFCQSNSYVFLFCFLGMWKWLPWRLVKCPWFWLLSNFVEVEGEGRREADTVEEKTQKLPI